MPDEKHLQSAKISPIKDTNSDGILQGSEIREQLRKEEEAGSKRTANESVHGILETIGIRDIAEIYANHMLSAQLSDNSANSVKELQQAGANKIQELLKAAGVFMETPRSVAILEKDLAKLESRQNISPETKEIIKADAENFAAFGKALRSTFPNGIKILPEDTTEIMGHFANIPIIIPKQKDVNRTEI